MIRWAFLHHRCASRLVATALERTAVRGGLRCSPVLNWADHVPTEQEIRDLATTYDLVISGQARPETPGILDQIGEPWRGIHVTRDWRRLWLSAYLSHLETHPLETLPGLDRHRQVLQRLSFIDGLQHDGAFYVTAQAIVSVRSPVWRRAQIRETRLDAWHGDPVRALTPLWEWLGLPPVTAEDLRPDPTRQHQGE